MPLSLLFARSVLNLWLTVFFNTALLLGGTVSLTTARASFHLRVIYPSHQGRLVIPHEPSSHFPNVRIPELTFLPVFLCPPKPRSLAPLIGLGHSFQAGGWCEIVVFIFFLFFICNARGFLNQVMQEGIHISILSLSLIFSSGSSIFAPEPPVSQSPISLEGVTH